MAHTPTTTTTLADILKDDLAPSIVQATAEKSFLLSILEQKVGKVAYGGKAFIIPLQFNNMGSTISVTDSDTLADAMPGSYEQASVPIYGSSFSLALTALSMAVSDADKYAWAEAMAADVMVKTRAFRQQQNRKLNSQGTGILAQAAANASTVYVTVDNAHGLSGFNDSVVNGDRFVTPNMKVDFYTGASIRDTPGGATITAITRGSFPSTAAILEFTAAADINEVVDGDYMYVAGSKGNEYPGLGLLIDDGTIGTTFQSVVIANNPEFASHVHYGSTSGTAEAITDKRIMNLIDDVEAEGGTVDWALTSNAVWLTIMDMMKAQTQLVSINTNKTPLDTSFPGIEYAGFDIFKDPYSIDHLYLVDNRAIKIREVQPQGWMEYDGSVLHQVSQTTVYAAYWMWFMTPAIENRKWTGKMQDITVGFDKNLK